jgi:hypothetical protein
MMSLKFILSLFMLLTCFVVVTVAKKNKEEETAHAIRDMKMGMAGLQEAASNPAVLAQLMKDLQVCSSEIHHRFARVPSFKFHTYFCIAFEK